MPSPLHNQIAATGTAARLSPPLTVSVYTIKAPRTNVATVYIGGASLTTANGYPLDPGDEFTYQRNDQVAPPALSLTISDWWVVGTTGDKVAWTASP